MGWSVRCGVGDGVLGVGWVVRWSGRGGLGGRGRVGCEGRGGEGDREGERQPAWAQRDEAPGEGREQGGQH